MHFYELSLQSGLYNSAPAISVAYSELCDLTVKFDLSLVMGHGSQFIQGIFRVTGVLTLCGL